MKRTLLWGVLALSLGANAAVGVAALRSRPGAEAMPLFVRVSLEDEQKQRIMTLRKDFLAFRQDSHARTQQLRGRLSGLLKSDAPDEAAVEQVLAEITQTQIALQRRVVRHMLAVRSVLRPDQRPAFEELMETQLRAGAPLAPPPAQ